MRNRWLYCLVECCNKYCLLNVLHQRREQSVFWGYCFEGPGDLEMTLTTQDERACSWNVGSTPAPTPALKVQLRRSPSEWFFPSDKIAILMCSFYNKAIICRHRLMYLTSCWSFVTMEKDNKTIIKVKVTASLHRIYKQKKRYCFMRLTLFLC